MKIHTSKDVQLALETGQPILALESTIIAHGMPFPDNLKFAQQGESLCRDRGVTPAMIAIINGEIHVGLEKDLLIFIAEDDGVRKTSRRELGIAIAEKWHGATTVSSTMYIAHQVGIPVFSTGGIGGVHRGAEYSFDISQDLFALANIPMIVISAGAKSILDLPKTLEMMETLGITVVGYKTNDFPAFYSRKSGIKIDHRFDDIKLLANGFVKHRSLGFSSGMLVVNPPPKENEISNKVVSGYIENALRRAKELGVSGKNLTPFLLHEVYKESNGESLKTNIALALSNVKLGAEIAVELKNV